LTLTVIASVTVVSLIGAVPVISAEFGHRAPVLPLFRPTILAAGLILPTLNVAGVHGLIEGANDSIDALRGGRMRNCDWSYQYDHANGAKKFCTNWKTGHLLVLLKLDGSEDRPLFNKRCMIKYVASERKATDSETTQPKVLPQLCKVVHREHITVRIVVAKEIEGRSFYLGSATPMPKGTLAYASPLRFFLAD
jgi:hypothetical protein